MTVFWAAWLLALLADTGLDSTDFIYLIVGHTHDLIDTMFSFISRVLHRCDYLSVRHMFDIITATMKVPPLWKHLRDVCA